MMIDSPPLEFSNRVIRRLLDNSFGEDLIATPDDYLTIRTVFRYMGGSWKKISEGDPRSVRTLLDVVLKWGRDPKRLREVPRMLEK